MLTLLIGRGKSGKTYKLLECVKQCQGMDMAQRIVIVPEQLSHTTERRLSAICGDEISYVSDVLSFTRLYSRVCALCGGGARNTLDQTGRILTAKLALESVRHRLKVFASAVGRGEFLTSVTQMIDEMKRYEITPALLQKTAGETTGMFSEKLSELALILDAYEAVMARGTLDPRDKLTMLAKKLKESGYASGRYFFVDGFTDYSAQELRVLRQLLTDSHNMTVTVPCDDLLGEDPLFAPGRETARQLMAMAESCGEKIRIIRTDYRRPLPEALTYLEQNFMNYGAQPFSDCAGAIVLTDFSDRLQECRRCAGVVKKHAMDGMRYRDMAIAVCDDAGYGALLEVVFRSMDIPLYCSKKKSILSHPAVSFVLLALEAVADNLETETVIAYLKTGYSGVPEDICDAMENYAIVWRIRGSRWQTAWHLHPEGYDGVITPELEVELKELNQMKERSISPLLHLRQKLRMGENVQAQIQAIYDFMEETKLYEALEQEIRKDTEAGNQEQAQETAQIYGILMECLKQIYGVLGKTAPKVDELKKILHLALSQYQVGTIPAVLDAVTYGSVEQLRGTEPELLYVIGANDGTLPVVSTGGSMLSERERRVLLDEYEIRLAPDSEKNLERQLLNIYSVFTSPREKLYISWCTQNENGQPSFLVERVARLFPSAGAANPVETEYTSQQAAEEYLMYRDNLEEAALVKAIGAAAREITDLAEAIAEGKAANTVRSMEISPEQARRLFGQPVALTASRLDQLGKCPLSFFLNYGIGAKKRREATFDAAEFGTFVHYILEKTVKQLSEKEEITAIDREESAKMVEVHLEEYARSRAGMEEQTPRSKYLFERNGEEAAMLLTEISEELSNSDFHPCDFELHFGGNGTLPAVEVTGENGTGRLSGFVDRVDVWETAEESFLRVVDYKSGTKKFDYTELYGGVGMQMLLYLFAMKPHGDKAIIPAGVLYMPAKRPFSAGDAEGEEENRKRTGLVLEEDAVLEAMEHGGTFRYLPISGGKSGHGAYAVSRKQMEALRVFTAEKMSEAVDQIISGKFDPKPFYRGRSQDPCKYCDFSEVCQKDKQFRRENYREEISASEFWEKIGGQEHE